MTLAQSCQLTLAFFRANQSMEVIAIYGVRSHREDRSVLQELAKAGTAEKGPKTRIGILNEDGELYRVIECGLTRECDRVIASLVAVGFVPSNKQVDLPDVMAVFEKP